MQEVPNHIRALVEYGMNLIEAESVRLRAQSAQHRHLLSKNLTLLARCWDSLVVVAKHKLYPLGEYIDWTMPSDWMLEHHRFVAHVPGLSEIVAEYHRFQDGTNLLLMRADWYLDHWEVASHGTWVSYGAREKTLEFILAKAREQYCDKAHQVSEPNGYKEFGNAVTRIPAEELSAVIDDEIITHEPPIPLEEIPYRDELGKQLSDAIKQSIPLPLPFPPDAVITIICPSCQITQELDRDEFDCDRETEWECAKCGVAFTIHKDGDVYVAVKIQDEKAPKDRPKFDNGGSVWWKNGEEVHPKDIYEVRSSSWQEDRWYYHIVGVHGILHEVPESELN